MSNLGPAETVTPKPCAHRVSGRCVASITCLLTAVLVGLVLRVAGIADVSLSHWDEAFYWRSGVLPLHQELPLHAPPGYPLLINLVHQIRGAAWYPAGALVSAILGTATIPLLFLLGRRVSGTAFGLAAAWALALSDLHVAYSRICLTDATFGFCFVLAMYAVLRVLEQGPTLWVTAAALATGVAWNVKYNGWMPIPIGMSALVAGSIRSWGNRFWRSTSATDVPPRMRSRNDAVTTLERPVNGASLDVRSQASVLFKLSLAGIGAVLFFIPWYRYVELNYRGGYAKVVQYHSYFVGGLAAWWDHASHLARILPAFRHLGCMITVAGGLIALCWLLARRSAVNPERTGAENALPQSLANRVVVIIVLALATTAAAGAGTDTFWFAAAGPSSLVCLAWGNRRDLLLAAWFGAFLVLVPSYHPYVRLLIPAVPAAILVTMRAAMLSFSLCPGVSRSEQSPLRRTAWLQVMAAALAICFACGRWDLDELRGTWQRWSSKQSYRAFARFVEDHTPRGSLIVAITQPNVWSGLSTDNRVPEHSRLLSGAATSPPSYLAVDFTMHMHPNDLPSDLQRIELCLTPVGSIANDLSIPALVNLLTPEEFWAKIVFPPLASPALGLPRPLGEPAEDRLVLFRLDGCTLSDAESRAAYRRVLRSGTVFYSGRSF